MNRFSKTLLLIGGTLSVILGAIGMFLPVLPTTPFLLLAAVCYARSSDRFYRWLVGNNWLGSYIRNYREGKGMPKTQKILALMALWLTIMVSIIFGVSQWWLRGLLLAIAVTVTFHIVKIKTYRPEDPFTGQIPTFQKSFKGEKE